MSGIIYELLIVGIIIYSLYYLYTVFIKEP